MRCGVLCCSLELKLCQGVCFNTPPHERRPIPSPVVHPTQEEGGTTNHLGQVTGGVVALADKTPGDPLESEELRVHLWEIAGLALHSPPKPPADPEQLGTGVCWALLAFQRVNSDERPMVLLLNGI